MKLVNKDDDIDGLDDFFFTKVAVRKKCPELSEVIIFILTLSHEQADIEKGFSRNKIVLQQNIKGDPIFSKRIIKDHMLANKIQPYSVEITNEMRKSVRAARTDMLFIQRKRKRMKVLKPKVVKKSLTEKLRGWERDY